MLGLVSFWFQMGEDYYFVPKKPLSEAFEIQEGASASGQVTPGFFYSVQNDPWSCRRSRAPAPGPR